MGSENKTGLVELRDNELILLALKRIIEGLNLQPSTSSAWIDRERLLVEIERRIK